MSGSTSAIRPTDDPRDGERFHVVTLTPYLYRVLAPAGWKDRVNKGERDWAIARRIAVDLDAAGIGA